MLYTVADARPVIAPFVEAGSCPTATTVLTRLNECTERLMNKATWWNLIRRIRFYTTNNTVTLPREADKILKVDMAEAPARVFNQAYEFIDGGPGELRPSDGIQQDLLDLGDGWPIFFDIPEDDPQYLVAFSTDLADEGLSLTLWGKDQYSAEIAPAGVTLPITRWQNGVEGSVDATNLTRITTQQFKEITDVAKPVSVGHVSLYTYDPTDHRMYFLCKYHPDETRPSYRRYRITAPNWENHTNVLCLIKLRFVPMIRDTDTLLIQNLSALKLMAMAIREENDRQWQSAEITEQKAVRLLNEQHLSKQGNEINLQIEFEHGLGQIKNMV